MPYITASIIIQLMGMMVPYFQKMQKEGESGRRKMNQWTRFLTIGVLILQGLKNVNFDDMDQMLPVSIMLIGMPISGSIGHGIGLAMISYTIIKVFSGKAKDVSVLTYVISLLFLIKFFAVV